MRVLLFGATGQVGAALTARLRGDADQIVELVTPSSAEVPLTDAVALEHYIEAQAPQVIVNAAAYTRVDDAEREPDVAFAVNGVAPGVMARVAQRHGARLVHLSTDYVFDGTGSLPYGTEATPSPVNVYGASKLAGEEAVQRACPTAAIVRTAWVHSGGGVNFVATAVRLLGAGTSMRVVDDQVGAPTHADTLAESIMRLMHPAAAGGVLHVTDAGVASWYDVACCVLDTMRAHGRVADVVTVTPVASGAFPRPARRPVVSLLDTHATRQRLGFTPPHWRDGVMASTRQLLGV